MRFVLMIEAQQGLSYGDQVTLAKRAEANGFEAFFRSDHYASFPGPAGHPTTDAWTVIAGLARDTDRIGLGVLVSPVTFRRPGSFAKVVTTADEMSGGRVEVGLGAGWNERSTLSWGCRSRRSRSARTCSRNSSRSCTACGASRTGGRSRGRAPRSPTPSSTRSPSRSRDGRSCRRRRPAAHHHGWRGSPRSLRLAARWADEFNTSSLGPDRIARSTPHWTRPAWPSDGTRPRWPDRR